MGLDAVWLHRLARQAKGRGIPAVPALLRKTIFYLHHCWVPAEAEIGEGTVFGYGGLGVVIHESARIGRHCLISQHVTIGGRSGREGAPVIGDYVRIGAGAQVLGKVRVGNFAVIGANAVVIRDVAQGAVVAGVPARELRRDPDPLKSYLREHTAHRLTDEPGGRNVIVP
jgi:serine O-acetyltransferase